MGLVTELPSDWQLFCIYPAKGKQTMVRLMPNLSLRRGTVLGQVEGTRELYGPYDVSAVDGRAVARLLLSSDLATDAAGHVTLATLVVGQGRLADRLFERAAAFLAGSFACEDLVGLSVQAAAQLGRIVQGTVSRGVLEMG